MMLTYYITTLFPSDGLRRPGPYQAGRGTAPPPFFIRPITCREGLFSLLFADDSGLSEFLLDFYRPLGYNISSGLLVDIRQGQAV